MSALPRNLIGHDMRRHCERCDKQLDELKKEMTGELRGMLLMCRLQLLLGTLIITGLAIMPHLIYCT